MISLELLTIEENLVQLKTNKKALCRQCELTLRTLLTVHSLLWTETDWGTTADGDHQSVH